VTRTYVDGIGEQVPESDESRTIDLIPKAAAVVEEWWKVSGSGNGLVSFARPAAI
jgi:hypothetical protein